MRRREFLTALAGTAVYPPKSFAQQRTPTIGFVHARGEEDTRSIVAAFNVGLAEVGYFNSQNVSVEYRWANGQYDRLPAFVSEFAALGAKVLVAGAEPAALAAKAAPSNMPVVFAIGSDPIKLGLVASYNRPGANTTGINILTTTLQAKRLGLLHDLMPGLTTVGFIMNPTFTPTAAQLKDAQDAALSLRLNLRELHASSVAEIEAVYKTITEEKILGVLQAGDPFFDTQRARFASLAARAGVPAMYQFREYAVAGGLMSYGIDLSDVYRQVGVYAGRILKGAKPADLPVLQPTKFEFVINMKAAQALGLKLSDNLRSLADELIE